jgi:hypothetical protein
MMLAMSSIASIITSDLALQKSDVHSALTRYLARAPANRPVRASGLAVIALAVIVIMTAGSASAGLGMGLIFAVTALSLFAVLV